MCFFSSSKRYAASALYGRLLGQTDPPYSRKMDADCRWPGKQNKTTDTFSREVLGYDLAGFFERNSDRIRKEIESITEALLQ